MSPNPFPLVVSVLLDAIPTPVFLKDRSGRFTGVNRAYEDVAGLSRATIVGKTVSELYPKDLADRYTAADEALYADPSQRQVYEVPLETPRGRRDMLTTKSVFRDEAGEVAGLIGVFSDLTEQRQAERLLIEANEQLEHRINERTRAVARANSVLKATLESTADGILAVDHRQKIVAFNDRFLSLWKIPPEVSSSGDDAAMVAVAAGRVRDPEAFRRRVDELYAIGGEATDELELADGRIFERYSLPLRMANEPPGRVWCFRDVTREHELEVEMRHAQKMEAVGRLAGGVAHDFNNLLTVILANTALVTETLGETHAATPDVAEIRAAGERAAQLTRQLLTFSRKQVVVAQRVELNTVLKDLSRMLVRLLGSDIYVDVRCGSDVGLIEGDPGQVEQVIANLCVNARDAMPSGGTLVVATKKLSAEAAKAAGFPQGAVELSVSDTGTGIADDVREHIFEPFFTTKERGKGTGLGLSTVYGIVKHAGGTIDLESKVGHGTTFRITWPCAPEGAVLEKVSAPVLKVRSGNASVLLVEDEGALRRVLGRQLRRAGYEVVEAAHAHEAELRAAQHQRPFDVLVTDVVMPGKSGTALARELKERGQVRSVVFMSGFSGESEQVPSDAVLLPKPFQVAALIGRIAELVAPPTR